MKMEREQGLREKAKHSLSISQFAAHGAKVHRFLDDLEILGKFAAIHGLQKGPAFFMLLQLSQYHMARLQVISVIITNIITI